MKYAWSRSSRNDIKKSNEIFKEFKLIPFKKQVLLI